MWDTDKVSKHTNEATNLSHSCSIARDRISFGNLKVSRYVNSPCQCHVINRSAEYTIEMNFGTMTSGKSRPVRQDGLNQCFVSSYLLCDSVL